MRSNPTCLACPNAHNGINGRFCKQLRRYVEYDQHPTCNINPLTNAQQ